MTPGGQLNWLTLMWLHPDVETPAEVALGQDGFVYVFGRSCISPTSSELAPFCSDSTGDAYTVHKVGSNGQAIWYRLYTLPAGAQAKAPALVAGNGDVYLTGRVDLGPYGKHYLTVKYNYNGTLAWARYYSGALDPGATAIARDGSGNVYVTGKGTGPGSRGSTVAGFRTIRYSPSGVLQAEAFLPTPDAPVGVWATAYSPYICNYLYVSGGRWLVRYNLNPVCHASSPAPLFKAGETEGEASAEEPAVEWVEGMLEEETTGPLGPVETAEPVRDRSAGR